MKNVFYFSFAISFALISCTVNQRKEESKELSADCGPLETLSVDKAFCEIMNLPEAEFTVQFPKRLKTDPPSAEDRNIHYNYFLKWDENEIQTEAYSLGYSTVQRNSPFKDALSLDILNQIKTMWEQGGMVFSSEFIGKKEFDGKQYALFQGKGKIDKKELEFVGDYLVQCIIVEPDVDDKNGVFIMMMANQDSDIKTFEDFADKGCISVIWNSFEFTY